MIVWGSGGKVVNCGAVRSEHCEVCEKERRFNLILQYRYWGVYWIFHFITVNQLTSTTRCSLLPGPPMQVAASFGLSDRFR